MLAILAIALSREPTFALGIQLMLAAGIIIYVIHNEPELIKLLQKLEPTK